MCWQVAGKIEKINKKIPEIFGDFFIIIGLLKINV